MVSNNGDQQLPEDVMIDILSRLPVKSLMRFRSVCKKWYALIRNPSFITKHCDHNNSGRGVVVYHYNYVMEKYDFAQLDENLTVPHVYQDYDYPEHNITLLGSFHGIICIFHWFPHLALWNPATREIRLLPTDHHNFPPHFFNFSHNIGFGLDPLTNDYKVIWMRLFWDEKIDTIHHPTFASVYTLSTDSWRHLEVVLPSNRRVFGRRAVRNSMGNTYLNGVYYWATYADDGTYTYPDQNYMILSFDMSNEIFGEMPGPPDICESLHEYAELTMYNGFIAMLIWCPNAVEKYFYIWVMKEEGLWTKELTIGPLQGVRSPLGFWKIDELFLENSTSQLVLYNLGTQEFVNLGFRGKEDNLEVLFYKESLVSIMGRNECHEGDIVKFPDLLSLGHEKV
ncbi:hypothetical protein F0562_004447 [Nyssa sinensis]|uniref:F-box domain-containing protein n=1 Tax=Nyssa sinensis TaxID=561372 RepID=A0A5J5BYK1_9ASTE|nr:hypothetical protein F0562_004447 [Nyssa sinensis]